MDRSLVPGMAYLLRCDEVPESLMAEFLLTDRLIFAAPEGDVKQLRALVAQAQLKASGSSRLILITDAHLLSEIMQNTLLKLLEEPPSTAVIVLQTTQTNRLLPTVMSRLSVLPFNLVTAPKTRPEVDLGKDGAWSALTDCSKDEAIGELTKQIAVARERLLSEPNALGAKRVQLLDLAIKKLNQNANQKLTIDWLLLQIRSDSGYMI